jgi:hypothetical protein
LVKQAAHNSSDECSNHFNLNSSAGIGRQGDLKIRWLKIMNVQVVPRIRPIRPMVKTELFQCLYKGSNPLWVIFGDIV